MFKKSLLLCLLSGLLTAPSFAATNCIRIHNQSANVQIRCDRDSDSHQHLWRGGNYFCYKNDLSLKITVGRNTTYHYSRAFNNNCHSNKYLKVTLQQLCEMGSCYMNWVRECASHSERDGTSDDCEL